MSEGLLWPGQQQENRGGSLAPYYCREVLLLGNLTFLKSSAPKTGNRQKYSTNFTKLALKTIKCFKCHQRWRNFHPQSNNRTVMIINYIKIARRKYLSAANKQYMNAATAVGFLSDSNH